MSLKVLDQESKSILMDEKANSCDTAASTFIYLFPPYFFFLKFRPVFCYHAACAMMSYLSLILSFDLRSLVSPAPALLFAKIDVSS